MSEIEKMYENAGIKPDCTYLFLVDGNGENEAARTISIGSKADLKRWIVDCGVKGKVIKSTNTLKPFYPPFTAEKQIELIKWLAKKDDYTCNYCEIEPRKDGQEWLSYCHFKSWTSNTFEKALAGLINNLWQDLTEEEKASIKNILEM